VRHAILSAVLLAVALVFQLTIVNRLPWPGAGGPDLVLLVVVALGMCSGPAVGAVTGFGAGLGLDIAPPGSYLIGEYALVFCLVGYLSGRLRSAANESALLAVAAAMVVAAAGEALYALIGLAVSDPQVSWTAVRQVLPSAVIYDVVLTPFVMFAIVRLVRWADALGRLGTAGSRTADGSALLARSPAPGSALPGAAMAGATVLGGAGLLGGAGWLAGPVGARGSRGPRAARGGPRVHIPSTPRLRQAASRSGDGWVGGSPRARLSAPAGLSVAGRSGRAPRLRPGAGTPGSALARPPRARPRSPATLRIGANRRRDGSLGRALGTGAAGLAGAGGVAGSALRGRRGSGPPGSAFRTRRPDASRSAIGARPGGLGRGGSAHAPRFRSETRLPGGSASSGAALRSSGAALRSSGAALRSSGAALRSSGSAPRMMPSRRATLRLGTGRRHDGVFGGGVLGSRMLRSGALRGGPRRGLVARPVSLRLGSGRRGDGALNGLSGRRGSWAGPRLGGRQAVPRFRSGPALGGHSLLGRRSPLRAGKRGGRFTPGRSSVLSTWTGGRLGGRSTVWRIGSKRTGGLR
jgi:rod shape-determining protein MreD